MTTAAFDMIEEIAFVVALTTNLALAVVLAFALGMSVHPTQDPYPTPAERFNPLDHFHTPKGPSCDASGWCDEVR